jgi:mannosyltransferase OCH1-like enzyme
MSFKIVIANRTAKVLGTLAKTLSYPFHFLFPKKRFTIPLQSAPLIKPKSQTKIPKIIWQTNYTNKVSLPVYLNYLFNRLLSLDFEYRYVSTEARLEFINKHADARTATAFKKLTDGASQADFWRVFVLNEIGGVYMDIDAHCVWPLSKMIQPEDTEIILLNKEHYTNYFMASAKNNPVLKKTLEIIIENIEQKNIGSGVYELTGPMALNRAIGDTKVNSRFYRVTCVQGSFTNEYFQYIDKPRGKWTYADKNTLLKEEN